MKRVRRCSAALQSVGVRVRLLEVCRSSFFCSSPRAHAGSFVIIWGGGKTAAEGVRALAEVKRPPWSECLAAEKDYPRVGRDESAPGTLVPLRRAYSLDPDKGRSTVNVEPLPNSLSAVIEPPIASTTVRQMYNPSPRPP